MEAAAFVDRSHSLLSLDEVRASGRPAFFLDYGEALLFIDGELFDLQDGGAALQAGGDPLPLPRDVLEHGVGIEYGWRHTARCDCDVCTRDPAATWYRRIAA
jgi:hypothetical protein